jgi:hypothetical protein
MLSGHALLIAAIFVPYLAMMITLGLYMWCQVRRHLNDPPDSADEDERDRESAEMRLAA